jgi:hypothetical protein
VIALAAFFFMQGAAPEPAPAPVPASLQAYYDCAAARSERLAAARDRRPARDIVASAISSCGSLRGPALAAGLSLMLADPGVQAWIRTENVPPEEARRVGEFEFDRAMRRQLLRNIGANPDTEGSSDARD